MLVPTLWHTILDGLEHISSPTTDKPVRRVAPADQNTVVCKYDECLGSLFAHQVHKLGRQVDRPDERCKNSTIASIAADAGLGEGAEKGMNREGIGLGCLPFVVRDPANPEEIRNSVCAGDCMRRSVLGVSHFVEQRLQKAALDGIWKHIKDDLAPSQHVEPLQEIGVEICWLALRAAGEC